MSGTGESRRWKPPIGDGAKAAFVAAMRAGAPRQEAAAAGGYALNSFYRVARSDGAFRAAWDEAHAASARAERRLSPGPSGCPFHGRSGCASFSPSGCPSAAVPAVPLSEQSSGRISGETRIVSNNRRVLQRRKMRHVRFDEARQQVFLAYFSWTCDAAAAAAEAGVCERTVFVHRGKDSVFAAAFQEALELAYVRLEAEALRQRLAAQQRLRKAIEEAQPPAEPPVEDVAGCAAAGALGPVEAAAEFERVMKLLARWDRRCATPGSRQVSHGRQRTATFEEAMEALEKKLQALAIPIVVLPEEEK